MAEDKLNCYFFRRGASVHWGYTMPEANVEYFYNEVLVTEENVRNSSYYMMNGFSEGYMGIQQTSSGEHTILFSVWSPYSTDNPSDIPEDKRVKLLKVRMSLSESLEMKEAVDKVGYIAVGKLARCTKRLFR